MEYLKFIESVLVPQAGVSLREFYQKFCNWVDIGIERKPDALPASLADLETEKSLRDLITNQYPDHGIWGEEFGAYKIDCDYVWVLDPLDGTREFLAKKPGSFGSLMGVLDKRKAVIGAIADPINDRVYLSDQTNPRPNILKTLQDNIIACTNLDGMFKLSFTQAHKDRTKNITSELNCMGFRSVIEGSVNAFVEIRIRLHDISPALPILINAGIKVLDLKGSNYANKQFNVSQAETQRYEEIASYSPDLPDQIVTLYQEAACQILC